MDKFLEILIVQYGFACQEHEKILRDSDQSTLGGSYEIQASSETMKNRFRAIEKHLEENYQRKL